MCWYESLYYVLPKCETRVDDDVTSLEVNGNTCWYTPKAITSFLICQVCTTHDFMSARLSYINKKNGNTEGSESLSIVLSVLTAL